MRNRILGCWVGWGLVSIAAACGPAHNPAPAASSSAAAPVTPPVVAATALPVEPATTPPAPSNINPFLGADLYVNPSYASKVSASVTAHPAEARQFERLKQFPTAV